MHCLKELLADGTAIKQLPFSCRFLKNLTILSLGRCNNNSPSKSWLPLVMSWVSPRRQHDSTRFLPHSISGLCSLRTLILKDCNLNEASIPTDIGSLSSLQHLDLGSNNFDSISYSLCHLSKLDGLWLEDCKNLRSVQELPPTLRILNVDDCTSLEKLPLSNCQKLEHLFLANCNRLADIQNPRNLDSTRTTHRELSSIRNNAIKDCLIKGKYSKEIVYSIFFPANKIPEWYINQGMGSSISFNMPFQAKNKLIGLFIWAVCSAKEGGAVTTAPFYVLYDKTNGVEQILSSTVRNNIPVTQTEHSWWSIISAIDFLPVKGGERMELSIKISPSVEVKKCAIHLVYKPNIRESQQGQLSCANTIVQDYVHPKRSRDVDPMESGNNLKEKQKECKRLRIEPDSTRI